MIRTPDVRRPAEKPALEALPAVSLAHALTLSERLMIHRRYGSRLDAAELDLPAGRYWADKLKAAPPFNLVPHLWDRFLAANGLGEEELQLALSIPEGFLARHAGDFSSWAGDLEEALAEYDWEDPPAFDRPLAMGSQVRLLTFSKPILSWALGRIRRGLPALDLGSGDPAFPAEKIEALFLKALASASYAVTHRMLVLELNVCRLQGDLSGATPGERFESFVDRLADPEYNRALHEEYIVQSRELIEIVTNIADFCVSFLRHFSNDKKMLEDTFFGGEPTGPIASVRMSGDSHKGGKRVLILEFDSGHKLVYKPHCLAVDEHFQSLLQWLNGQGFSPSFRVMKCLDRGDHGWAEFISTSDCSTEDQVRRFYLRQGGLLAVLYAMLATDFHHENLIAAGEHPILVDLESLFHPTLPPASASQLEQRVHSAMTYSVLRTALLPTLLSIGRDRIPYEVGGLSDVEGQQSPQATPYVNMAVEDEAHIARTKMTMLGSQNIPTLQGVKPEPAAYTPQIVEGFTAMYRLLLEKREALLAPEGPLQSFAGDTVRLILRHTRAYSLLSQETLHPDLQRNALDRDCHFLRLWALLEEREDAAGLIESEVAALWRGDIPFFSSRTDSFDVFDHLDRRHPDVLPYRCLDEVTQHVRHLDERDLSRQVWLIQCAMSCQRIQPGDHGAARSAKGSSFLPGAGGTAPSRAAFLEEALRIGDHLAGLALSGHAGHTDEQAGTTWLGLALISEKVWRVIPLGIDLYNGLGGIALFLAYLGRVAKEDKYSSLARTTLTEILRQQSGVQAKIPSNGAFSGWGGLVYLYTHLYSLWQEPFLLEAALHGARQMAAVAGQDQNHDVLYGNSGGILALDGLYEIHPVSEVLEAMQCCGEHLLSQAQPMAAGIGWHCDLLSGQPLSGFSHGAAGIAMALEVLYRRTGQARYREGATAALAYERSLFSAEHGNWKDMRIHRPDAGPETEALPVKYPVAWCNGASGIGLSRFRMPAPLDDPAAKRDIETALQTTRSSGFGLTHCLCHGDLGNLELFLEARRAAWPTLSEGEVEEHAAGILAGIRQHGWICGTPRGIETPGLMTGLAGIGYGFLRLYDPARVPSVLLLDSPNLETP